METTTLVAEAPAGRAAPLGLPAASIRRFARRQPVGFAAGIVIVLLVLVALFAPLIAPYGSSELSRGARLLSPSRAHLFGTDDKGRDNFSRVVYGARVSLEVGLIAVAIGVLGGAALGVISGYLGGTTDLVLQRFMDAILSFPALVLALALAALLQPGILTAMIAIGIVIIPGANRLVRGVCLSVKQNAFVEAARAIGASDGRVILRHILPNIYAYMIVMASIVMGFAIIVEAGLSFLGAGVQPPAPSWGQSLSYGRSYMEDAPWLVLAPGGAITVVVLAFNLLGDALRDHLDPSLRGR
jgi:peptide/nickel transport system permease protein